jgi:thiol:disulfide interchange protein DsbC
VRQGQGQGLDGLDGARPGPATASCDTTALNRNIEFGKKHKITGTPTLIFADGSRVPGAINAQQVEKFLAEAK